MASVTAIAHTVGSRALPNSVQAWLATLDVQVERVEDAAEVAAMAMRGRPRFIILDGRDNHEAAAIELLTALKCDSYTAVIPAIVVTDSVPRFIAHAFSAGADEVLTPSFSDVEAAIRLDAVLRRSDRDVMVHPSTRLPGAVEIDAEIGRRMSAERSFAACYADLDHFKEFNDRYSYYQGDRVIQILSLILHDVVRGICGREGFVGHIGGDDFIFVIPIESVPEVCMEIISVFDDLIALQYSDEDRQAGYFFGKDRRGQVHKVPLMTVSIGVVTTERRRFTHAAQVSALATEMKSYAKTLPGSVYAIDRRSDDRPVDEPRLSGPIRLITPAPPPREGAGS